MEYIINWILFLVTFLIGYFLGQGKISKEKVAKTLEGAIELAKTGDTIRIGQVGAIKAPTARDQYLKEHPLEKEGMAAMAKDLKEKGI